MIFYMPPSRKTGKRCFYLGQFTGFARNILPASFKINVFPKAEPPPGEPPIASGQESLGLNFAVYT
jgi:hypothetical protein